MGYPVTAEPRLTSHNTLPVSWSNARKRPLASPPNSSLPPVATSDVVAARCSYFHTVRPVSTDTAWMAPTFSPLPGAIWLRLLNPYSELNDGRSICVVTVMQAFCSGKYIVLLSGL